MSEEIDFSKATEKLSELLSSDEGKAKIESIVSAFQGGESENKNEDNFDGDSLEMMMKIKEVMALMKSEENAGQVKLLKSLVPILKPERQEKLSKAIKLMSMGKAIKVFKNM